MERKQRSLPPFNAKISSEIVEVGPPLTPEQAKIWRDKQGILDPDRPLIPTCAEIDSLPRLARAAFLQRSSERVAPLRSSSNTGESELQIAVNLIVSAATIHTPVKSLLRCIRRDYDRLFHLARKNNWTDDTPVSPDVFGPMWPNGLLPRWAKESKS